MKFSFVFILLILLSPLTVHAAGIGFVNSSGIWFSSEPAFASIPVKAYTVVLNNDFKKLTATIQFIDNGSEFARTTVEVLQDDARQITVIWTPTTGTHTIAAKFVSATVIDFNGNTKILSATEISNLAEPISRTTVIDSDSDHDGLGDHDEISTYGTSPTKFDTDDDALGDKDEIFKYKTDPKNANTDGDSMNDGDEVHVGRNPLVKDDPAPPPPPPPPVVIIQPAPQKPPPQTEPPAKTKAITPTQTTLNTESVQKKKTVTTTAPQKDLIPEIPPLVTELPATSTTSSASTTPAAPEPIAAAAIEKESDGNWVIVLGVLAALLAAAALVTGGLAWREKNKY